MAPSISPRDRDDDPSYNAPMPPSEIILGILTIILLFVLAGGLIYSWRYHKPAKVWFSSGCDQIYSWFQKVRGKKENKDIEAQPTGMAPVANPAPVVLPRKPVPRAAPPAWPHPGLNIAYPSMNPFTAPEYEMQDIDLNDPERAVVNPPPGGNWI